jgi:hypothetical protein
MRWLLRIVAAYQLEQRHFVCLLQTYFLTWKISNESNRLTLRALRYTRSSDKDSKRLGK